MCFCIFELFFNCLKCLWFWDLLFFKVVQFNFEHNYHKLNQQPLVFISEKLLDDCFIPFSVQKHGYGNSACSSVVWLFLLVVVVSHSFVTGLCTPWFYTVPSTLVSRFERWCFRFRKGALSNLKNALFCQTMFAILKVLEALFVRDTACWWLWPHERGSSFPGPLG